MSMGSLRCLIWALAILGPLESGAQGPPTRAEAEAVLAALKGAAASGDCAAILALLDEASEVKTTLRLGPQERLFLHSRAELVAELPKLLKPAAASRVSTHLLSLTPAGDAPAAMMKYQWGITLARPEGELRVEATGGAIVQRGAGGRVVVSRANQLITRGGREGKSKVYNPREGKDSPKVWDSPGPKKKGTPEPGAEPIPAVPVPAS
ncbi:MAG: hypothetical protein IT577_06060 [Verrucomicrobiae bacterium]|nr:hypothetical protein [Verrucomicrobiae bacterium]